MATTPSSATKYIDLIGFLVLCLVAAASGYWGIGGSLKKTQALRTEHKQLMTQLAYMTELGNVLGEGEEKLNILRKEIEELDRLLPETIQFQDFYTMLHQCARQTNVLISDVQPEDIVARDGYMEMSVPFSLSATFENFYKFLLLITNSPRLTKLGHLSIRPSDITELFKISLTVDIYCAGQGEEAADGA